MVIRKLLEWAWPHAVFRGNLIAQSFDKFLQTITDRRPEFGKGRLPINQGSILFHPECLFRGLREIVVGIDYLHFIDADSLPVVIPTQTAASRTMNRARCAGKPWRNRQVMLIGREPRCST